MTGETLLVLQEGAEIHRLYLDSIVLGRSSGCDLSFEKSGVSRRHCEIVLRPDGVLLRDLGSTHGTFVNGEPMAGEALLACGDVVRLGDHGPRLRVLDAKLSGVPLVAAQGGAGGPGGAASKTAPAAPPRARAAALPRTESVDPSTGVATAHGAPSRAGTSPAAAGPPSPAGDDGLRRGLLIGVGSGVALGLALLVVVGFEPWLDSIRAALGLG